MGYLWLPFTVGARPANAKRRPSAPLPRRNLDDEVLLQLALLVEARVHVGAGRDADQASLLRLLAGDLHEVGDRLRVALLVEPDQLDRLLAVLDRDRVAGLEQQARDRRLVAV